MRAFVCSYLDEESQRESGAIIARLVAVSEGRLHSIPAATAHLTYAFIATLPEPSLPALQHAIERAAAAARQVAATVGPPAILYGGREARLVHLPVTSNGEEVAAVARAMADAAGRALPDVAIAPTPAPHVTLARFRRGTRRREAHMVADLIAHEMDTIRLDVQIAAAHIVESQQGPNGPRYVIRHTTVFGEP